MLHIFLMDHKASVSGQKQGKKSPHHSNLKMYFYITFSQSFLLSHVLRCLIIWHQVFLHAPRKPMRYSWKQGSRQPVINSELLSGHIRQPYNLYPTALQPDYSLHFSPWTLCWSYTWLPISKVSTEQQSSLSSSTQPFVWTTILILHILPTKLTTIFIYMFSQTQLRISDSFHLFAYFSYFWLCANNGGILLNSEILFWFLGLKMENNQQSHMILINVAFN